MGKTKGRLISLGGFITIVVSLFLPWYKTWLGYQWLFLDDLQGYFLAFGSLFDACGESTLCFIVITATFLMIIGLILSGLGIRFGIVGIFGAIVTIFAPGANFFADLLIGEIYNTGLGVYICMAGCIILAIGCFMHAARDPYDIDYY